MQERKNNLGRLKEELTVKIKNLREINTKVNDNKIASIRNISPFNEEQLKKIEQVIQGADLNKLISLNTNLEKSFKKINEKLKSILEIVKKANEDTYKITEQLKNVNSVEAPAIRAELKKYMEDFSSAKDYDELDALKIYHEEVGTLKNLESRAQKLLTPDDQLQEVEEIREGKEKSSKKVSFAENLAQIREIPRDLTEAMDLYEKGINEEKEKNLVEAEKSYKDAADLGYVKAKTKLARIYLTKKGSYPKDIEKAFELLNDAANAGHVTAQIYLASMFEYGDGIDVNLAEAKKWYLKAEEQQENSTTEAKKAIKEGLARIAIISLFPNGSITDSKFHEDGTMTTRFTTSELFNAARDVFEKNGHLHPTNAFGNNTLSLSITPKLEEQLKSGQLKNEIDEAYRENQEKNETTLEEQKTDPDIDTLTKAIEDFEKELEKRETNEEKITDKGIPKPEQNETATQQNPLETPNDAVEQVEQEKNKKQEELNEWGEEQTQEQIKTPTSITEQLKNIVNLKAASEKLKVELETIQSSKEDEARSKRLAELQKKVEFVEEQDKAFTELEKFLQDNSGFKYYSDIKDDLKKHQIDKDIDRHLEPAFLFSTDNTISFDLRRAQGFKKAVEQDYNKLSSKIETFSLCPNLKESLKKYTDSLPPATKGFWKPQIQKDLGTLGNLTSTMEQIVERIERLKEHAETMGSEEQKNSLLGEIQRYEEELKRIRSIEDLEINLENILSRLKQLHDKTFNLPNKTLLRNEINEIIENVKTFDPDKAKTTQLNKNPTAFTERKKKILKELEVAEGKLTTSTELEEIKKTVTELQRQMNGLVAITNDLESKKQENQGYAFYPNLQIELEQSTESVEKLVEKHEAHSKEFGRVNQKMQTLGTQLAAIKTAPAIDTAQKLLVTLNVEGKQKLKGVTALKGDKHSLEQLENWLQENVEKPLQRLQTFNEQQHLDQQFLAQGTDKWREFLKGEIIEDLKKLHPEKHPNGYFTLIDHYFKLANPDKPNEEIDAKFDSLMRDNLVKSSGVIAVIKDDLEDYKKKLADPHVEAKKEMVERYLAKIALIEKTINDMAPPQTQAKYTGEVTPHANLKEAKDAAQAYCETDKEIGAVRVNPNLEKKETFVASDNKIISWNREIQVQGKAPLKTACIKHSAVEGLNTITKVDLYVDDVSKFKNLPRERDARNLFVSTPNNKIMEWSDEIVDNTTKDGYSKGSIVTLSDRMGGKILPPESIEALAISWKRKDPTVQLHFATSKYKTGMFFDSQVKLAESNIQKKEAPEQKKETVLSAKKISKEEERILKDDKKEKSKAKAKEEIPRFGIS